MRKKEAVQELEAFSMPYLPTVADFADSVMDLDANNEIDG